MRKTPYYIEIYNYIIRQIYLGNLQEGDCLPSFDELCGQFGVSANTIRGAMRKLSADGYIKTGRGRPTTISLISKNQTPVIRLLLSRRLFISQTYDLLCILLPATIAASIRTFSKQDCEEAVAIADKMKQTYENISEYRRLRTVLLEKLLSNADNLLAVRIIHDSEEVIMLPQIEFVRLSITRESALKFRGFFSSSIYNIIIQIKDQQFNQAKRNFLTLYRQTRDYVNSQMKILAEFSHLDENAADSPAESPMHLYDYITSDIIDKIYRGDYTAGCYLPGEVQMCEQFGVSLPTVKKAYQILNDLGIAKTMNGKGTEITLFENGLPEIGPDLLLHISEFLEILQILTSIIKDAALCAARNMPPSKPYDLEQEIRRLRKERGDNFYVTPLLIYEVIKCTDYTALISLYQVFETKLIWNIYLDRYDEYPEQNFEQCYYYCLEALIELQQKHWERFADIMEQLLIYSYEKYNVCYQKLLDAAGDTLPGE